MENKSEFLKVGLEAVKKAEEVIRKYYLVGAVKNKFLVKNSFIVGLYGIFVLVYF